MDSLSERSGQGLAVLDYIDIVWILNDPLVRALRPYGLLGCLFSPAATRAMCRQVYRTADVYTNLIRYCSDPEWIGAVSDS